MEELPLTIIIVDHVESVAPSDFCKLLCGALFAKVSNKQQVYWPLGRKQAATNTIPEPKADFHSFIFSDYFIVTTCHSHLGQLLLFSG